MADYKVVMASRKKYPNKPTLQTYFVDEGVREALHTYCLKNDMKYGHAVGRLVLWFIRQDETVKALIMDLLPAEFAVDLNEKVKDRVTLLSPDAMKYSEARKAVKKAVAKRSTPSKRPRRRKAE